MRHALQSHYHLCSKKHEGRGGGGGGGGGNQIKTNGITCKSTEDVWLFASHAGVLKDQSLL